MWLLKWLLSLALCAMYQTGFAQSAAPAQGTSTLPNPPRIKKSTLIPKPALEVPENPEKYNWTIKVRDGETAISVYLFDANGHGDAMGTVAGGGNIELIEFRRVGRRFFYVYPWTEGKIAGATYWVDGNNIEFAGPKAK